jgi:inhibitor of cysteine peptidase
MKAIVLGTLVLGLAVAARADADSIKREIAVGEIVPITLPCNPTTGYEWELKAIDRKVAVPSGPIEYRQAPAGPGMAGVGGTCVLPVKGVKPGKTEAVLVYRRPWEKGAPAKTFKVHIKVLPEKPARQP